jgi:hypothetical protein
MKNITKNLISAFVLVLVGILSLGGNFALAAVSTHPTPPIGPTPPHPSPIVIGSGNSVAPLLTATYSVTSATATNITTNSATLNGTVNPNGSTVNAWFQDSAGHTLAGSEVSGITGVVGVALPPYPLTGLTPHTNYTYELFVTDGPDMISKPISFTTTGGLSFLINSASATGITTTSATLNGTVNPNGSTVNAWFQDSAGHTLAGSQVNGITGLVGVALPPYSLSGLTPSTSYTYKFVATDGINILIQNISFTTNSISTGGGGGGGGGGYYYSPSVTTESASNVLDTSATLNGLVNPEGNTTTAWFEYGTSSNLATFNSTIPVSEGSLNTSLTFAQSISGLSQNTTYYFRAAANNTYGTIKGNILSFTAGNSIVNNANEIVTTVQAINKTSTSARLGGIFVNQNGISTQGYFQYGTTPSMNSNTSAINLGTGSSLNFSDTAKNLLPGTIYYFRAVALKQGITYDGKILVFKTPKTSVIKTNTNNSNSNTNANENHNNVPPPVPAPTGPVITSENQSSILNITDTVKNVSVNDEIDYLVTFKNNTAENFENDKITVQLPQQVDFENSNFGKTGDDNTVVFDAGILVPAQVGSMTITGKVNSQASAQNVLVTTAVMSYNTASSDIEKDEVAYVTNDVLNSATGLAANSIFGASFMPSNLLEWLILILVILGLAFVSRRVYMNYALKKNSARNSNPSDYSDHSDHIDNLPM